MGVRLCRVAATAEVLKVLSMSRKEPVQNVLVLLKGWIIIVHFFNVKFAFKKAFSLD